MNIGTIAKLVGLGLAALVTGCATTVGGTAEDDFGTIAARTMRAHVKAVRDHVRADRAAIKAAFRDAFGYQGAFVELSSSERTAAAVLDRTDGAYSERTATAHRNDSAVPPVPTTVVSAYRDGRRHPIAVDEMQSIEMNVGLTEMLASDGTLHPRAASALARMNAMAREQGGDFSVAVPRSHLHTGAAIQAVAPGATIVATDESEYRLIVLTPDR